jgi:hypothetical protein
MARKLCERKKALKKDPDALARLVDQPRFSCTECGRVANKKKYVCEPRKLDPEAVRLDARQVA